LLPRGPPFSGYETAQDFRRSLKRRNETERGSKALSPDSRRSARPFRVDFRPGTRQSDQAAYPQARPRGASGTGLCRMPRAAPAGAIPPSHVVVSAGTAGMAIVPGISPAAGEPPPSEGKRAPTHPAATRDRISLIAVGPVRRPTGPTPKKPRTGRRPRRQPFRRQPGRRRGAGRGCPPFVASDRCPAMRLFSPPCNKPGSSSLHSYSITSSSPSVPTDACPRPEAGRWHRFFPVHRLFPKAASPSPKQRKAHGRRWSNRQTLSRMPRRSPCCPLWCA
jgi:hypothetical protein